MAATVGCSVVTCGYLPYARVLASSFREYNPNADFVVLLVDDHERRIGPGEPFRVIRPDEVGITPDELDLRGLMYTPTELVCSLRPALLRHLLDEGASAVIQMDSDGYVYSDLQPIAERAHSSGTLFTPHFLAPHPPPGSGDSLELLQIRYGVMNGGFLAVGPASVDFLDWLHLRLARHCLNRPDQGFYLDQRWLDLALGLFPHEVLRDSGCNVMCLNLNDRDVVWRDDHPSMPDGPLRYFHFLLAFDPEAPQRLCDERFERQWLPYLEQRPGALRLAREYAQQLLAHGSPQSRSKSQHYDTLPGGLPIDRHIRAAYHRGVIEAELAGHSLPPNPFSDGDTDGLLRWLAEPCGTSIEDTGLSRYTRAIRDIRPDLVSAFPSVPGEHTQRFLAWVDAERGGEWMRQYTTDTLVAPRIAGDIRVDRRMRELYLEALRRHSDGHDAPMPASPYSDGAPEGFLAWLLEPEQPASQEGHLSRYLLRVWAERSELRDAFPAVPGADTGRYLAWVTAEADVPGVDVPRALLPSPASVEVD